MRVNRACPTDHWFRTGPLIISETKIMGDAIVQMRSGREAMRWRCIEIALANMPPCVQAIKIRRSLSGRARLDGIMETPRPFTRRLDSTR